MHRQPGSYLGRVNMIGSLSCCNECFRPTRTFNTYGACMLLDDDRLVDNFILQALRGQLLTLYRDVSSPAANILWTIFWMALSC